MTIAAGRPAGPFLERAAKIRGLAEAQAEGDLIQAQVGIAQELDRQFPPNADEDLVEGRALLGQLPVPDPSTITTRAAQLSALPARSTEARAPTAESHYFLLSFAFALPSPLFRLLFAKSEP